MGGKSTNLHSDSTFKAPLIVYRSRELQIFRVPSTMGSLGASELWKWTEFAVSGDVNLTIITLNECPKTDKICPPMSESPKKPGRQLLSGYVTLKPGATVSADELRSFLNQKLPRQLVPNTVSIIESMPTLPNGKLDKRALANRASRLSESSQSIHTANETAHDITSTERALVEIWESVLEIPNVLPTDDFFSLGGHSLLAARLVALTNERLASKLSVADLFDYSVLGDLASLIDESK